MWFFIICAAIVIGLAVSEGKRAKRESAPVIDGAIYGAAEGFKWIWAFLVVALLGGIGFFSYLQ